MILAGEKHCNELARVWAGTGRQEVLGGRMQAPGSSDHAASWQKEATSKRSTRVQRNDSGSGITSTWLARVVEKGTGLGWHGSSGGAKEVTKGSEK